MIPVSVLTNETLEDLVRVVKLSQDTQRNLLDAIKELNTVVVELTERVARLEQRQAQQDWEAQQVPSSSNA